MTKSSSLKPPLTELPIEIKETGFYAGFNHIVTVGSKILIGLLILWAAVFPDVAGQVLTAMNKWLLMNFGTWYMRVVLF